MKCIKYGEGVKSEKHCFYGHLTKSIQKVGKIAENARFENVKLVFSLTCYTQSVTIFWAPHIIIPIVTVCFWWHSNKHGIVASLTAWSEPTLFYLWHKLKNKVFSITYCTGHSIQDAVSLISPTEFWCEMNNKFVTCNACPIAKGNHFQYILSIW